MNRFLLSAKSLISTSWLVRSAILSFAVISILFATLEQATPIVILFLCLLPGAGYTSRVYLRSERRRLVPGMNETCATVAIAFLFVSWIICCVFISAIHGMSPEIAGGCFLGLAFALWLGCLEKAAVVALIFPYAIPLLLVSYKDASTNLFNSYHALPEPTHVLAGATLALAGIALVARYWFIITSKYSPLVHQNPKPTKGINKFTLVGTGVFGGLLLALVAVNFISDYSQQQTAGDWGAALSTTALHTTLAFAISGALYVCWRGLIQYCSPSRKSLTVVGHFLFGPGNANTWKMMPWIIAGVFTVSFIATKIIVGSESDEAINAKIGFGLLFPCFITSAFVMHGIPKLYSRLWLAGASENRNDTGKILLLTMLARTLPATLAVIAWMLSMALSTTVGLVPTLVLSMLFIAIGVAIIWAILKCYPFITRHISIFIILYVLAALVGTLYTVTFAHELIMNTAQAVQFAGPLASILLALAMATATSAFCVWDASRSVSRSSKFMEVNDESFIVVHLP